MNRNETKNIGETQKFSIKRGKYFLNKYSALPVFLLIFLIACAMSGVFLTGNNITNVLRQVSANGIISIGMTFVVLTGGIDISVGSVVGISSIMFASTFQPDGMVPPFNIIPQILNAIIPGNKYVGTILAVLLIMLICSGLGYLNGLGVAKGKLPAFIMTMGTLTLFRGIALLFSNGKPLYMDEELADKIYWLGNSRFFNIPLPVYIFIAVALIAWLVLEKTVFGRYIRAIGGNYEAARVAGIHVDRYKIASYVICAALAALAGILVTSRTTTGEPMLGQSYEMDAIAATVIGGTVLTGGIGTIIGTVLGAFIIGVINNILNLTNVSPYFQYVVKGLIIIVAVLIKTDKKKR